MASENHLDLVNKALNDVFGCQVRYDTGGKIVNPVGTYTGESIIVQGDGAVISTAPMFTIRDADMPASIKPERGHRITIESKMYKVNEVQRDDSNAWLLSLKRCG